MAPIISARPLAQLRRPVTPPTAASRREHRLHCAGNVGLAAACQVALGRKLGGYLARDMPPACNCWASATTSGRTSKSLSLSLQFCKSVAYVYSRSRRRNIGSTLVLCYEV